MITLLIRAATLEGSGEGILYFIKPQWEKLAQAEVSAEKFHFLSKTAIHSLIKYFSILK